MNKLLEHSEFSTWIRRLTDAKGKARILDRLVSARNGNFGDCAPVGEGVSEMRIHVGPGYRVYFTKRGTEIYLLLLGGDKSSQSRDITRAKSLAKSLPQAPVEPKEG